MQCNFGFFLLTFYSARGSRDFEKWTERDVCDWVRDFGPLYFKKMVPLFSDYAVTGKMLKGIDDEMLQELGADKKMGVEIIRRNFEFETKKKDRIFL